MEPLCKIYFTSPLYQWQENCYGLQRSECNIKNSGRLTHLCEGLPHIRLWTAFIFPLDVVILMLHGKGFSSDPFCFGIQGSGVDVLNIALSSRRIYKLCKVGTAVWVWNFIDRQIGVWTRLWHRVNIMIFFYGPNKTIYVVLAVLSILFYLSVYRSIKCHSCN